MVAKSVSNRFTAPPGGRLVRTILILALNTVIVNITTQTLAAGNQTDAGGPVFVLLGTTRVGDRYSAMLRHRDGSHVRVVSEGGEVNPINAYPEFQILAIESTRVAIGQPSDQPCVAYPGFGVSCESSNITTLNLRTTVAASENEVGSKRISTGVSDIDEAAAQPDSLIDSIKDRAQQQGVPPEIPPGMEMIRTSSGYRLIPED